MYFSSYQNSPVFVFFLWGMDRYKCPGFKEAPIPFLGLFHKVVQIRLNNTKGSGASTKDFGHGAEFDIPGKGKKNRSPRKRANRFERQIGALGMPRRNLACECYHVLSV